MTKAADELRELFGIVNDTLISRAFGRPLGNLDQAPFIDYLAGNNGRAGHAPYWVVRRFGYNTDPSSGHPTWGQKCFMVLSPKHREATRLLAIEWTTKRYKLDGIEWKRSPFGGWHPAPVIDAMQQALKARKEQS